MKMLRALVISALAAPGLFSGGPALAHARLEDATIADGAEIAELPAECVFHFSTPVALARVTLENASGENIPLDFTPARQEAASHAVSLPAIAPGSYTLILRAMSDDGHVMANSISFTLIEQDEAESR